MQNWEKGKHRAQKYNRRDGIRARAVIVNEAHMAVTINHETEVIPDID